MVLKVDLAPGYASPWTVFLRSGCGRNCLMVPVEMLQCSVSVDRAILPIETAKNNLPNLVVS